MERMFRAVAPWLHVEMMESSSEAERAAALRRVKVLLALGCVYVIWGSTYYAIRIALGGFPPMIMAGTRHLSAGLLLMAVLRMRGAALPTLTQWGSSFLVGTLLQAVGNGGVVYAEQYVDSSLAAILVASVPLCAALMAGLC